MYSKGSVVSGLGGKSSIAAAAKGRAMQGAAGLGMDRAQQEQQMGVQQMQEASRQRQQQAQNNARGLDADSQYRTQTGAINARRQAFDVGQRFDYAALQRRQQLNIQQALLNNVARDF